MLEEELVEASCDLPLVAEPVLEEEPKPEEAVPEKAGLASSPGLAAKVCEGGGARVFFHEVKEKVANFSGEWTLERIEGGLLSSTVDLSQVCLFGAAVRCGAAVFPR